jgi:hypothetical protein
MAALPDLFVRYTSPYYPEPTNRQGRPNVQGDAPASCSNYSNMIKLTSWIGMVLIAFLSRHSDAFVLLGVTETLT